MHIDISIASFKFPNQIADRLALQRAGQVGAGQNASNDSTPDGNPEFGRAEQESHYRTVLPYPPKMDMGLRDSGDISYDKAKS